MMSEVNPVSERAAPWSSVAGLLSFAGLFGVGLYAEGSQRLDACVYLLLLLLMALTLFFLIWSAVVLLGAGPRPSVHHGFDVIIPPDQQDTRNLLAEAVRGPIQRT